MRAGKGIALAIAYYAMQDYEVYQPIIDSSRFDLVVYDGNGFLRVEVKTTTQQSGDVGLRTLGGNQSWNGVVRKISMDDCDRVFCVNLNTGVQREFTAAELEGRSTIRVK